MPDYLLSIICPTFNSARTLRVLIESVLQQDCDNYELIFIDGESTDETLSIIKEYGDKLTYISEHDNGVYDAMNKGIRMAKGDWLYFIGGDDSLYSNDVISKLQPYLTENVDFLMCDIMSPRLGRCTSVFSKQMYYHNTIHHQGVIYRKEVLQNHPYDTHYKIVADYELNMFLWHNGYKYKTIDIILANHSPVGLTGYVHFINYKEEISIKNKYVKNVFLRIFFILLGVSKFCYRKLFVRLDKYYL